MRAARHPPMTAQLAAGEPLPGRERPVRLRRLQEIDDRILRTLTRRRATSVTWALRALCRVFDADMCIYWVGIFLIAGSPWSQIGEAVAPPMIVASILAGLFKRAVRRALQTIGRIDPQQARVVQNADTLHLDTVRVSTSCLEDVRASETCTVDGEPYDFPFDEAGTLADI